MFINVSYDYPQDNLIRDKYLGDNKSDFCLELSFNVLIVGLTTLSITRTGFMFIGIPEGNKIAFVCLKVIDRYFLQ